jgi:hypothetical protein
MLQRTVSIGGRSRWRDPDFGRPSEIMRHIVARDMLRNSPRADIPISANQEWKS